MNTVKESMQELTNSFNDFKTTHAAETEVKTQSQVLDLKISELGQKIEKAAQRLNQLEVKLSRPGLQDTIGDPLRTEHKTAFLAYVRKGDVGQLEALETKALSTQTGPEGGYTIPQEISDHLLGTIEDHSLMRRLARVMTISTEAVDLLVDRREADAGWVAETADRSETEAPQLEKIKIPVHEMYAKPKATQKLLDDSKINIEEWLSARIAQKMAQMENQAFLHGDGDKKPVGFLTCSTLEGKSEWGKLQLFKTGVDAGFKDTGAGDVLIDVSNSLKPRYLKDAVWIMSRSALAAIRKLKDKNDQYLWYSGFEGDGKWKLLGYPVEVCDEMPGIDQKTVSIAFGNFKEGYQIVDRSGTHVLRDPYSSKPYIEFYTTRRVGGNVINFDAIKLLAFAK